MPLLKKNIKMHYPQISFARISDWDLRRKESVGHILTIKKTLEDEF